jgi:hypothetical protein
MTLIEETTKAYIILIRKSEGDILPDLDGESAALRVVGF